MHVNNKVVAGVLGTGALAVAGAGVAFAAWSSNGAGTGAGASTTDKVSTIAAVAPVVGDNLYPGAVTNAYVTIDNPNAYPVVVSSISAGYSRATASACAATTVRTDAVPTTAGGIAQSNSSTKTIAAGATATYKLVLRMSNTATDECKSQPFVLGGSSTDGTGNMTATLVSVANTSGNDF